MKSIIKLNWLVTIVLFCCITKIGFTQNLKDVLSKPETPLLYLGIDFSKAKLLDNGNPDDIKNRLYTSINQLIVNEPKKYDLKAAFDKNTVDYDFTAVTKSNATANVNEILSTNSADYARFKAADITTNVKNLDLSGKNGIGVLLVMESMRKVNKKSDAAIWVTFIDMKAKKILMTERMESKGKGGIGFRNYWASAIRDLLEEIEGSKYNEWQKKYGS